MDPIALERAFHGGQQTLTQAEPAIPPIDQQPRQQ